MGMGGFLAARSDAEHYEQELLRERREGLRLRFVDLPRVAQTVGTLGVCRLFGAQLSIKATEFRERQVGPASSQHTLTLFKLNGICDANSPSKR